MVDVSACAFTPDPLRGTESTHHLVTLSSIKDDAPLEQNCFLDAVRWGAASSADVSDCVKIHQNGRFGHGRHLRLDAVTNKTAKVFGDN